MAGGTPFFFAAAQGTIICGYISARGPDVLGADICIIYTVISPAGTVAVITDIGLGQFNHSITVCVGAGLKIREVICIVTGITRYIGTL